MMNQTEQAQTEPNLTGLGRIKEVGKFLKVSRATIYSLMESGQLSYVKIGKSRRIPWDAVKQLIARNLRGSAPTDANHTVSRYWD
jgi:excisionase family DNA binding protein